MSQTTTRATTAPWSKSRSPAVLRFALFSALPLVAVLWLQPYLGWLNRITAALAGMCANIFAGHAVTTGDIISLNGFRVQVITECTALYCVFLYGAFVAAVPASAKARAVGLLLGVSVLSAANILRIALVTIIGAYHPDYFEVSHIYLGQIVMIVLLCSACMAWLKWADAEQKEGVSSGFFSRLMAIASLLFLLWLPVHRGYVLMIDRLVIALFTLIDYRLFIPPRPEIYHHTLSLIIFASLMLASRSAGLKRKICGLAAGLALLSFVHMTFRTTQVLLTAFHMQSLFKLHNFVYTLNQYLLPILLWLAFVFVRRPEQARAEKPQKSLATVQKNADRKRRLKRQES